MAKKRVLVIDDEEPIQQVIQACLEDLGDLEVLTATSGKDGLAIAQSVLPDGILLDVSMPDQDGITTFEKLQQNPATRVIPVALLTARVQPEDRIRFAELGIAGIIVKPFDPLTLIDEVANAFDWEL